MHSTLCQELRGTSKLLRSVRSRPRNQSPAPKRKFNTQTRLYSKPPTELNNASAADKDPSPRADRNGWPPVTGGAISGDHVKAFDDLNRLIRETPELSGLAQRWLLVREETAREGRITPKIKERLDEVLRAVEKKTRNLPARGQQDRTQTVNGSKPTIDGSPAKSANNIHASNAPKSLTIRENHPSPTDARIAKIDGQDAQSPEERQITKSTLASGGDSLPSEPEPTSDVKFYGSAAARRQRERLPRSREKQSTFVLPEWFHERRVLTWGEGELDPEITPRTTLIHDPAQSSLTFAMQLIDDLKDPSAFEKGRNHPEEPKLAPEELDDYIRFLQSSRHTSNTNEPNSNSGSLATQTHQDQVDTIKKESYAPGGAGASHSDSDVPPPKPDSDAKSETGQVDIVDVNDGYCLHGAQLAELSMTIQGRLRLPASGSPQNKPGGIRSHVIVHYTASDGDLFLHHLMIDVARHLQCNLIQIDVQDISALIAKADIDPMLIDEAKTLSYEVFGEVYREESNEEAFMPPPWAEEMEEADEDDGPSPKGIPFMVGKPITIDLRNIFGSKGSRKGGSPFFPKNMIRDVFGRPQQPKSAPHIFSSIIDSILSSPQHARKQSETETSAETIDSSSEEKASTKYLPKDATIVHIKDLKAIQETNIGKHFLTQLYEQIEHRRGNGEGIMIVGTECARESNSVYDLERIRNMQISEPDEISSTVVLTPPLRHSNGVVGHNGKSRFQAFNTKIDRAKHLQMINARHLYEMLQSKDVTIEPLREGFWVKEFAQELTTDDQKCLAKGFWSFSYVQRLAAIMTSSAASSDFTTAGDSPISKSIKILERSDALKTEWVKETQPQKSRPARREKTTEEPENEKLAAIRSKATKHEKKLLGGVIEPKKIPTTFQNIHIPADTIDALQTLTTLSLVRPDAFKYGVLASDRIPGLLLYGPPGTGKTLAAKAVAKESGATMLEVSAADINDMYVGEGEKNVKALFSLAKKLSPCIVFLDEADAMFSSRSHAGRRVNHRELLNQFLREWDGMSNDSGSAFIMVATNRPMDLDDAVLRRLPRRLLIDLPTENDRAEILGIHLRGEDVSKEVSVKDLAVRTPFYSGSDLKNLVVAAALNCVREENERAKQHTGEEPFQYESKRVLNASHFERALEEIGSSISEDMASLRDIKKFDEQYGDKKGRKRRSPKWGFKTAAEADAVLDTVKVRS